MNEPDERGPCSHGEVLFQGVSFAGMNRSSHDDPFMSRQAEIVTTTT